MDTPKKALPPLPQALSELPISRFMETKVATVTPSTSIEVAMQILLNKEVTSVPVVTDSGKCVGILSEKDLMLLAATQSRTDKIKFTEDVDFVRADEKFKDVLVKLYKTQRKSFPVLNIHKQLEGMIARRDILKAIYFYSEK